MRVAAGAIVLAAALAACYETRTPLITADAASEAAVGMTTSSTPVSVLWVRLSSYEKEAAGGQAVPATTPVWAVAVSGRFPLSCGPAATAPKPCPTDHTTQLILVDARNGAFIQGLSPAPSGP